MENSSDAIVTFNATPGVTFANTTLSALNSTASHYVPYEIKWTWEVIFRVTVLIAVMILTFVGNSALIMMLLCNRRHRRKRVNIFVINLAIGDLMVCFFTMTTEILFVAFGEWVLGAIACKVIVYGQIVTLASATFLLTGMALDRYQVIVQPLQSLTGRPSIKLKVATAWILAFIFAVPQMLIFVQTDEGIYPDGSIKHSCRSQGYSAPWQRKVYFSFLTSYILVIPFIIMSYCYFNIMRVVWQRTDTEEEKAITPKVIVKFKTMKKGDEHYGKYGGVKVYFDDGVAKKKTASPERIVLPSKLVSSSKRKVIKMTLSIIIGFLVCESPYFTISMIRIYSNYKIKLEIGLLIAEVMALVHSALNPILFVIFSSKLFNREILMRMLRCDKRALAESRLESMTSHDDTTWCEADRIRHSVHMPGGRNSVLKCVTQYMKNGAELHNTTENGNGFGHSAYGSFLKRDRLDSPKTSNFSYVTSDNERKQLIRGYSESNSDLNEQIMSNTSSLNDNVPILQSPNRRDDGMN